jgi:hypothetical protein
VLFLNNKGVVPERLGGSSPENTINTITNTDILKEIEKEKTLKQALEHNTGEISEISISDTQQNNGIPSIGEWRVAMAEWFDDYPNWESDLYRLGIDKFISKTVEYHNNDPESIEIIKYFNKM